MRETEIGKIVLKEKDGSFCIGTDALLLAAYMKKSAKAKAVELGAGSGVISLITAVRNKFAQIRAVEIQEELFETLKENVEINGLTDKITPVNADLRDINYSDYAGVSVVFANPPYMKESSGKASEINFRQAARHEVFGGIREFAKCAAGILKTGGKFYTVYRPDRMESLFSALKESGFTPKRMTFVFADYEHTPSSVLTEAVKDGFESLYVTPPLILSGKDGEFVYENGRFPDKYYLK